MKCLSKVTNKYRRDCDEAERRRLEDEKLSKMTPDEQEKYKADRHRKAVETLSTLALFISYVGNKYYR
jgi:hypothetical protein